MRRPLLTAFLLLLCAILGVALGYLYAWWKLGPVQTSPIQDAQIGEGRAASAANLQGWCCYKGNPTCRIAARPVDCFNAGGLAMNASEKNCNFYCSNVNK